VTTDFFLYPPKINSARGFGQRYISIANISGADQAIDNRQTALSTFHVQRRKNWRKVLPATLIYYTMKMTGSPQKKVRHTFWPNMNEHAPRSTNLSIRSNWDCL